MHKTANVKVGPVTNGLPKSNSTPALPKITAQRSASPNGSGRPRSRQGSNLSSSGNRKSDSKQVGVAQLLKNIIVTVEISRMAVISSVYPL